MCQYLEREVCQYLEHEMCQYLSEGGTLREFEDMVKKDFIGQGHYYPTYALKLPSPSKTTPPPTTNPPPAALAPTYCGAGHVSTVRN
jgi:hypothetical protein